MVDLRLRIASLRPATADDETRTVDAVISTGAGVPRGAFLERLAISADAVVPHTEQIPLLDAHRQGSTDDVKGYATALRIEDGALIATLTVTDAETWRRVLDGTLRHLSIGYAVEAAAEEASTPGALPTITATRWRLYEISFVPVPADPGALIRSVPMEDEDTQQRAEGDTPAELVLEVTGGTLNVLSRAAGLTEDEAGQVQQEAAGGGDARRAALSALQRRSALVPQTQRVQVIADHAAPDVRARAMGEAMFARLRPDHTPSSEARQYLGLSLPELATVCLRNAGVPLTGLTPTARVTRALHTTSDFPLAIEATLGNFLRPAYARPRGGIELLANSTTVPNFDERKQVQFSEAPKLEKVNEAGEFKHGTLAELGETLYLVETWGRIISVSRQLIIGDKLGLINSIGTRFGNEAADFRLRKMIELLVSNAGAGPTMPDGKTLFHADHGNRVVAGDAISEATLSAARLAMRRQVDAFGERIQVTPKWLLVPPELETTAEKQLAAISAAKTSDVNAFANGLTLVVESRLTNATRWYVVADDVPGLEQATLEGEAQPELRTEAGFDVDGVRTRVRLDFGCGFTDHRGWYMNPGA